MQLEFPSPVASATPDGTVFVAGPYLQGTPIEGYEEYGVYFSTPYGCCDDPMCGVDWVEDLWRERALARSAARYKKVQARKSEIDDRHPLEIGAFSGGLRRSALLGERYYRRDARSDGYRQRSSRGRR